MGDIASEYVQMARTLALPDVTPGSPAGRDEIWTAVKGL